jgi:hypothetical protein
MVENEMAFVELDNQQKSIETIIDKKNSITAKIGATLNSQENKLEIKHEVLFVLNKYWFILKKI